jgi:post-segregation antitoxin (ccd killing protein)
MGTIKEKSRVNLYVSKSLSDDAKRLGINMSQSLERALKSEIAQKWQQQNQSKIDIYNSHILSDGLPFDDDDLAV